MALPLASFTVNDGASTPVAQTFSIIDRTGLASHYRNAAGVTVRGSQTFSHEVRLGKTNVAANRVLMTFIAPVEGVVDGQNKVLRQSLFRVEANFAPDATEAERQTQFGELVNILSNADVKSATQKLVSLG